MFQSTDLHSAGKAEKYEAPVMTTVRPVRDGSLVKSAARVLAILEFFDRVRRPASEREIFSALGFPQSSSSALLHTLADLGYLDYDYTSRLYNISERVSLLGNWQSCDMVHPGRVLALINEICETTGQTVALVRSHGAYIQYIHVQEPRHCSHSLLQSGIVRPICGTIPGAIFLNSAEDREIQSLIHRTNAEAISSEFFVQPQNFRAMLEESRIKGYAYGQSIFCSGLHVLSAALPATESRSQLALSIVSRAEDFTDRHAEYASVMIETINKAFGGPHQ